MYILAIESSSDISSVSIGDEKNIVCEYHFKHNMGLLRRLTVEIENMVNDSGLSVSDLGAIAVSLGPGSFTGLRIGITGAKMLSYALNIPIVGIPTLKAMAKNIAVFDQNMLICPMIFARVNEVYFAAFSSDSDGRLLQILDYQFDEIEKILEYPEFTDKKICFLGSGVERNRDIISAVLGSRAVFCDSMNNFPRGLSIISLAFDRLAAGDRDDPKSLVPMYIKKPTPVIRLGLVNGTK